MTHRSALPGVVTRVSLHMLCCLNRLARVLLVMELRFKRANPLFFSIYPVGSWAYGWNVWLWEVTLGHLRIFRRYRRLRQVQAQSIWVQWSVIPAHHASIAKCESLPVLRSHRLDLSISRSLASHHDRPLLQSWDLWLPLVLWQKGLELSWHHTAHLAVLFVYILVCFLWLLLAIWEALSVDVADEVVRIGEAVLLAI